MRSVTWRTTVCVAAAARGRAAGGEVAPYERGAADGNCVAIAAAGGIEPLIALLGSLSANEQNAAAEVLVNLADNGVCRGGGTRTCDGGAVAPYVYCGAAEIRIAIAAAGGIDPLVALLGSPSAEVQKSAAWALRNLARNGVCRGGGAWTCGV